MDMACYHRILRISHKKNVANEEICAKIQQAIGPHKDLLTILKRCRLQRYGHVCCSSGLAKPILRGTLKGERRQGRQKKRWEDIWEWTGFDYNKSQRTEKKEGNCMVVKSSVMPH